MFRATNSPKNLFKILLLIVSFVFIQSCSKDTPITESQETETYSAKHLTDYYTLVCKVTKNTPGFFPPQAARAYGYISIANYEAVRNGIEGAVSLQNQLNGFANYPLPTPQSGVEYNWAIASNAAVAKMMLLMYDKNLKNEDRLKIQDMESANLKVLSAIENADIVERSITYGKSVADVIYDFSKTDGGHESYLDPFQLPYTVPNDAHCWVPTSAVQNPLSPKWGTNRPFLVNNVTKVQPRMPVAFSSEKGSEFHKEAMFVYNTVQNNSSEQIEIAKYWADDPFATCTPAGHTFAILTQILQEERVSLSKASVAFARMGIAENDAFIACWKGKYDYVLIRPVSYIQRYIDPSFKTVIGTPPFPAYTSGHSCEIGAGARILTDLFTDGSGYYPFTDYSQLQFGFAARSFQNFNQMADECANSRLYGGIHYTFDNEKGLQVGKAIGDNVNKEIKWPAFIR
jgi:hypothetical protein